MSAPTPGTLAALCAAALPDERLTAAELDWICFEDGEILGDERGAAAMTVRSYGGYVGAWLLLLAVHPDDAGRGRGTALLADVIDRARGHGAADLHLASAVPRYVWPGVDLLHTRAAAFFEGAGLLNGDVNINMAIPTSFRSDPPPGVTVERETGTGAVEFCAAAYPHWVFELEAAVARGTAFAARAGDGRTVAFSCHSVNRAGWIGPMATDPALQARGVGSATLAAVCADLAARGFATGEIVWVSNLRFYAKCGARVSRVFRNGRLPLSPTV